MKVLVTGGAGFIGSNFIRYMLLNHEDIEIVNFDLLTYAGRLESLKDVKEDSRYRFIHGDIRETNAIEPLMKERFDLIVNFAAETHVDRSIAEAKSFVLTNIYGTYVLLDAARKFGTERFLQVSTDEVYGSIDKGTFKETDLIDPSNPYSASKAAADHIALAYHKTYGLSAVITRSSNNYGPFQYPEKLIPKFILCALQDQPLSIYGEGKQVRDWLYVSDNCAAIDMVARRGRVGEIYNIASGEERMNIDVAKDILRVLRKSENLIKTVPDRPGHDLRYSMNTGKIKNLGWKPKFSFGEGLERTVNWYLDSEWWWRPIFKTELLEADPFWMNSRR